jgi:3-deoxy-D-manno-octulosonate 8-phosphate phosphatase KdsC-like HAD superfamily phosphatase
VRFDEKPRGLAVGIDEVQEHLVARVVVELDPDAHVADVVRDVEVVRVGLAVVDRATVAARDGAVEAATRAGGGDGARCRRRALP